jgi:anaerobic magnesium-protoporphyrin IX monomethyl ester cyclase
MMRIVLSTTPIRPVPTDYPPFGSMSLIQALRKSGYDPFFYDIDGLRPSFDEVVRFYQDRRPDLIAISAVVSTAYAYTKQLCLALKKRLPDTPIVVGGNLAASAELLHRFCGVDVCAVGEGEKVIPKNGSARFPASLFWTKKATWSSPDTSPR